MTRRMILTSVLVLGLGAWLACTPPAQEATQAGPRASESSVAMTDTDFVSTTYAAGNAAFHGRTTIELLASGVAKVTQARGDSIQTFTKQLPAAERKAVVDQLMALQPCALRSQRPHGNPGEDEVTFQLTQSDSQCEVRFWVNERWDQAGLKQLVDLFRALERSVVAE